MMARSTNALRKGRIQMRKTPSIHSNSACSARPVHTDASNSEVVSRSQRFRSSPDNGHPPCKAKEDIRLSLSFAHRSQRAVPVASPRTALPLMKKLSRNRREQQYGQNPGTDEH